MDGHYAPPANEYRRPAGRLKIVDPRKTGSCDSHFVRGAQFTAREAFAGLAEGQALEIELVPEPGNPFDGYAVAVYVDAIRIGYLASGLAKPWQDIVVASNRLRNAVFATGVVRYSGAGNPGATVFLPWLRKSAVDFRDETVSECGAVFSGLTATMQQRVLDEFWVDLSDDCAAAIVKLRGRAPSLNWKPSSTLSLPFQLDWYFASIVLRARQIDADLKEAERAVLRAAAYERHLRGETPHQMATVLGCPGRAASRLLFEYFSAFSRKELAAMRPIKSPEQQALEQVVLRGFQDAGSAQHISETAGCSQKKVLAIIAADGQELLTGRQIVMRKERLAMAEQALALRKNETDRRKMAAKMECSFDVLVRLLEDGEFYEDPKTDKKRLKRALCCRRTKARGLCIEEAAVVAKMTVAQLKEARKDRVILKDLHDELYIQG